MKKEIKIIRAWLLFFMLSLFVSGLTAIPLETELSFVLKMLPADIGLSAFIQVVYESLKYTNNTYPFLAYGYDWLAFAHFVLAVLFIGPYKNPVRNKWVIEFGMIACVLIIPFAFIAGHFRQIPFYWQIIDCSFGIVGMVPLWIIYKKIQRLENSINTLQEIKSEIS